MLRTIRILLATPVYLLAYCVLIVALRLYPADVRKEVRENFQKKLACHRTGSQSQKNSGANSVGGISLLEREMGWYTVVLNKKSPVLNRACKVHNNML